MIKIGDILSVRTRVATEEDEALPAFDNTRLVAINTCPTWGLVRYGLGLRMPGTARQLALEAGSACHDVFAAARLWDLFQRKLTEHFTHHGDRLFGVIRFKEMLETLHKFKNDDERTQMLNFCLEALFTSGYHDDPRDTRRTVANLEESCIAYLDRIRWKRPVWVQELDDPTSAVGIEVPFNIVIEYELTDGHVYTFRFIGRLDGLHWDSDKLERIELEENKTASRLDDAWREAFSMSHQVTGYIIASRTLFELDVTRAVIHGLAIPQPRSRDYGGIERIPVMRYAHQFNEWFYWFLVSAMQYGEHQGHETDAPKWTHSCNRYFRPCPFIPLCYAPPEERGEMLDTMVLDEWNPLEEKGSN